MTDRVYWILVATIIAAVAGISIWLAIEDAKNWQSYAATHHCVPAGTMDGSISFGTDSKGRSTTNYNPSKTIYKCDGGEIHIR